MHEFLDYPVQSLGLYLFEVVLFLELLDSVLGDVELPDKLLAHGFGRRLSIVLQLAL